MAAGEFPDPSEINKNLLQEDLDFVALYEAIVGGSLPKNLSEIHAEKLAQFAKDIIMQGDSGDLAAVEEQLKAHFQKLADSKRGI